MRSLSQGQTFIFCSLIIRRIRSNKTVILKFRLRTVQIKEENKCIDVASVVNNS